MIPPQMAPQAGIPPELMAMLGGGPPMGPMTHGPMAQPGMMEGMELEPQAPNLLQLLQGPNANQILQVLMEALQMNQAPQGSMGPMMSALGGSRGGY
jgi:hypothetical protein